MDNLGFFIFSFVSIFVIVSPLGALVTFISLTNKMTFEEKNSIAKRSVFLACVISLFFAITGSMILDLFSISVDSLRVAGGILLFKVAFDMMLANISRESVTEDEINESIDRTDVWIFPMALPMLTGPGTITTAIVLMGSSGTITQKLIVLIAILLTFIICLILLIFSRRLYKFIGYTGMLVFTRLMGLFLAALAVDFITTGIWNIYNSLL